MTSRAKNFLSWRAALLFLTLCLLLCGRAAPLTPKESEVKAVLLFHLTHFVTWPDSAWTNETAPLVIGVLGPDPFGGALEAVTKDEKANGRPIVIRRANTAAELANVHILYVSQGARESWPRILNTIKSRPVLVISEAGDALNRGSMMRLRTSDDRKVRLQVDLDRVRRQGLNVSAQLLRVAEVVEGAR
jgi:hypothetical protein